MQSCRALQELARPSVTSSLRSRMVIRDLMHSLRDQNTDLKLFLCRASTMPRNVDYVCISCAAHLRPAGPHGDSVTLSISRQTITQAAPKVFFRSLLSRVLLDVESMLLPRALIPIAWGVGICSRMHPLSYANAIMGNLLSTGCSVRVFNSYYT